jgi:hypothetical protein
LDLGCDLGDLSSLVIFFAGRLGGWVFVLLLISRVVTHLQRIGVVGRCWFGRSCGVGMWESFSSFPPLVVVVALLATFRACRGLPSSPSRVAIFPSIGPF